MGARIVLFGATGYTGARTVEAMVARGVRPVLAGRDTRRLAELAERLGGLETALAHVGEPASVAALVGRGDLLVGTVGPFTAPREPAVRAAVEAGAVSLHSPGGPPSSRAGYLLQGPASGPAAGG